MSIAPEIASALRLEHPVRIENREQFESLYAVSELASASIAAVASATADLLDAANVLTESVDIAVDQRIGSLWFRQSLHPIDWELPPIWDAIAGDYQTQDGWIKLHTNLPHHREAACRVLGTKADREAVTQAVRKWDKDDLEAEIVAAGGVAAAMRSRAEWQAHPQGSALAAEPLLHQQTWPGKPSDSWQPSLARPLEGIKVLDLTRVLAGPVATRTLAGMGADVLRLDPLDWEEDNIVPEITLGKRCARLDLKANTYAEKFAELLRQADIFVHGYRPGALDALGFTPEWRRKQQSNLIEVSLCAYGWTGPWRRRRGFDSLVQMSCGIADAGMHWANTDAPTPLPVQALDHATGYLMAAAAIKALQSTATHNICSSSQFSLARTAELLLSLDQAAPGPSIDTLRETDFTTATELTPWGDARRLKTPFTINGIGLDWTDKPSCSLGSAAARWES